MGRTIGKVGGIVRKLEEEAKQFRMRYAVQVMADLVPQIPIIEAPFRSAINSLQAYEFSRNISLKLTGEERAEWRRIAGRHYAAYRRHVRTARAASDAICRSLYGKKAGAA